MYVIFTASVACWLVYGLLIESWPVVIANAITVALAGMILVLKIMRR